MNETWAIIRTNRMILIMNIIVCCALTVGYFVDYMKGRKTIAFFILLVVVMAIQLFINVAENKRDNASTRFKYFGILGNLVIYCFAMFSSDTYFTFTYMFPMLILYILYYDTKLIKASIFVAVVLNIIKILFQIYHGNTSAFDITSYTVQMASVIIFSLGVYFLTDLTMKINSEKVDKLIETNNNTLAMAKKADESSKAEAELVRKIENLIPPLVTSSKQMADGAQRLAEGANDQAESIDDLTNSLSDIGNMTNDYSELATMALDEVQETGRLMDICIEQINQMLVAMRTIDEKSKNIFVTTKLIDDISFQTNILALNAAVEAARAGQHGKGFGVVADEVRILALKSAEAAKQTSELLESSSQSVEEGNSIVEKVNSSLKSVVEIAQKNAEQIAKVQSISAEQSTAMNKVNNGLVQVGKVVQTNSANAEESAASSEELSAMAASLEDLIYEFRHRKTDE